MWNCFFFQGNVSPVSIIDPSELLRPEKKFASKNLNAFRDYTVNPDDPIQERVRQTYLEMHTKQTVDFVKGTVIDFLNQYFLVACFRAISHNVVKVHLICLL